jgi:hypothetical protein
VHLKATCTSLAKGCEFCCNVQTNKIYVWEWKQTRVQGSLFGDIRNIIYTRLQEFKTRANLKAIHRERPIWNKAPPSTHFWLTCCWDLKALI